MNLLSGNPVRNVTIESASFLADTGHCKAPAQHCKAPAQHCKAPARHCKAPAVRHCK